MNEVLIEVGSIVEAMVTEIAPYGAFLECPEGERGLLHISEISARFVTDIGDMIKLGQTIRVKVIAIDPNNNYLRFSLKQCPLPERPVRKTKIRVKLPPEEVNFAQLAAALPGWINEALAHKDEE